jgi:hypothetical protein
MRELFERQPDEDGGQEETKVANSVSPYGTMHRQEGHGALQFMVYLDPKLFVVGKLISAANERTIADFAEDTGLGESFPHFFDQAPL